MTVVVIASVFLAFQAVFHLPRPLGPLTFVGAGHPLDGLAVGHVAADQVGEHAHPDVGPVVRVEHLLELVGRAVRHQHDDLVALAALVVLAGLPAAAAP